MATSTYQQALTSDDADFIKQVRSSYKGKVTRCISAIKRVLVYADQDVFDHNNIDHEEVLDLVNDLKAAKSAVEELHTRFEVKRVHSDGQIEDKLIETDNQYIEEIETSVRGCLRLVNAYKLQQKAKDDLKINQKKMASEVSHYPVKLQSFKEKKAEYEACLVAANNVVASDNVSIKRTAAHHKSVLETEFNILRDLGKDLAELAPNVKNADPSDLEMLNCSKEILGYRQVVAELERVAKEVDLNDRIEVAKVAKPATVASPAVGTVSTEKSNILKLKVTPPSFSGKSRDFAVFKRDFEMIVAVDHRSDVEIGALLKDSVPQNYKYLLDKVALSNHKEMMQILVSKFGRARVIVDECTAEIRNMKVITNDKDFIDFVERLDKLKRDLEQLDLLSDIANTTVIADLESKLPYGVKRDWIKLVSSKELASETPSGIFNKLLEFLEDTKLQAEYHSIELRQTDAHTKASTKLGFVCGVEVSSKQQQSLIEPPRKDVRACLACADGTTDLRSAIHPTGNCAVWRSLSLQEKKGKVNCIKCPFGGKDTKHFTADCKKTKFKCHNCLQENDHHSWFCTKPKAKTNSTITKTSISGESLLLPPVMVKTMFVSVVSQKNNMPGKIGAMIDDCSTDHYVTHSVAKRYGFPSTDVELEVEGIGGKEQIIQTCLYTVNVIDGQGVMHEYLCYGLDEIATADVPSDESYAKICAKFGIHPHEVRKPKKIDLLISLRASAHHPSKVRSIGHMTLFSGIFGKVLGGPDPDLHFAQQFVSSMPAMVTSIRHCNRSRTLRAMAHAATLVNSSKVEKQFLDMLLDDKIGVDCAPKCGGCQCGQCPIGAKPMSLHDEREYNKFKNNLYYNETGSQFDPGPYWETKLPWNVEKSQLVDNKAAVIAVMNATKRKLGKDSRWEDVYESQLRELVECGFAREISELELSSWVADGGATYFMPHQVAVNPNSKSTPVRVVFNNTLNYKGYSMNASLDLGPDILTNLHGLLLRFRSDAVAAAGDIRKMYYMVRVSVEDQFMQLFLWRWKGEKQIRYYTMTRLVMGNKPSGPISCVAINETANLFDFASRFPSAHNALTNNSYVDNTFIVGPDIDRVRADICETELVAAKGGFYYKEWVVSGQKVGEQVIAVQLPNQIAPDEEKALGISWDVEKDLLSVKVDVTKPSKKARRKDMFVVDIGPNNVVQVRPILSLRSALSIHAKAYDPLGWILPCKMIGNLLLRLTIQVLKKDVQGPIPWDLEITGDLKQRWTRYFSMLIALSSIAFPRSFKPLNCNQNILPVLVLFSDGNPDSFGTCAYGVWTLLNGHKEARLIMAKAKLSAVLKKGETVRNELSGAVFACRVKEFICKQSGVIFGNHVLLIDSKIVQYMIQKSSYGYGTFAGLRVGELQQKTNPKNCLHIRSEDNIADILTRGASPSYLGPTSKWQCGPEWLSLEQNKWPASLPDNLVLSPDELNQEKMFHVKSVCKLAKTYQSTCIPSKPDLDKVIFRAGSLKKLIRTVVFVMRVELSDLKVITEASPHSNLSGGVHPNKLSKIDEISASEYHDAWLYLLEHDQEKRLIEKNIQRLVPIMIEEKLSNYDYSVKLYIIGGRVKNFPVKFAGNQHIPILPASSLGRLVVSYYHNKFHRDPDTTVTFTRNDVWVINCRKFASSLDSRCKICIVGRRHRASQIMGNLPSIRSTEVAPAWSAVNMDLFGPIQIRDECIKRGPRVVKKVWGVVFCCTRTRGVYLDIASDYSTESILHTVRRIMASKGQITNIISDCGLQLRGADKELREWRSSWDPLMLKRFGSDKGLNWHFVMPNSQHQNGAVEIMIKLVKGIKTSIMKSLGDTKLTYNEMNTMFLEIAQLCNERPIGIKPNSCTDPEYLSPNSLFLGRASDRIASGPFTPSEIFEENPIQFRTRFHLVQGITNQFWKVWTRLFFPSLLIRQKWHSSKRNIQVGDVCILQDSNTMRGEWRLVVVTNTYPDESGHVRNVEVKAKPRQDGSLPYVPTAASLMKRHVSNLILLVPVDSDKEVTGSSD